MTDPYTNEGRLVGRLMQFNDGTTGDLTDERYMLAEVTEVKDGFVELGFDCFSPKRRTYLRLRLSDLQRAIREETK
jgi:hypothetical protein